MDVNRLIELLGSVGKLRVGMLGDLCIDVYWLADMRRSELSRETPHFPLPVVREWFSPGAGGNLAANLLSLSPSETVVFGVLGDDWRASLLRRELHKRGANLSHVVEDKSRVTNGYCKPLRGGISDVVYEDPRLDFENYEPLSKETEEELLKSLERARELDVLCVGDQFFHGCVTKRVRECVMELAAHMRVVVDSRYNIGEYRGVVLKPNEIEGYAAVRGERPGAVTFEEYRECAAVLAKTNSSDVVMTLGASGSVFTGRGGGFCHVPAFKTEPPIDIVGAGDSMMAGLSLGLAAGASWSEAMTLGSLCSGVTVKKVGTTGTASPEELIGLLEAYSEVEDIS